MKQNLQAAITNAGKADALMFAIESCYLKFDFIPEEKELADRGVHAFYALWDVIHALRGNLDDLEGDSRVVDVLTVAKELRTKGHSEKP